MTAVTLDVLRASERSLRAVVGLAVLLWLLTAVGVVAVVAWALFDLATRPAAIAPLWPGFLCWLGAVTLFSREVRLQHRDLLAAQGAIALNESRVSRFPRAMGAIQ